MNVVTPVQQPTDAEARPLESKPAKARKLGPFKWDDPLLFEDQLTEDERAIRDAAHGFCQANLFTAASWRPTATNASTAPS